MGSTRDMCAAVVDYRAQNPIKTTQSIIIRLNLEPTSNFGRHRQLSRVAAYGHVMQYPPTDLRSMGGRIDTVI
jgi:hypothetical protein